MRVFSSGVAFIAGLTMLLTLTPCPAQGQTPSKDTLKLQRVNGKWKIASLADER